MTDDLIKTPLDQASRIMNVEAAWNSMADSRRPPDGQVRPEILQSWSRCLAHNTDMLQAKAWLETESEEKMGLNSYLLSVGPVHMQKLHELLKGQGFIIMLLAPDGFILSIKGDRRMCGLGEAVNLVPGGNNSEQHLGTTASSISLIQGIATQVLRHEHYCQFYHDWCCSASPIYDRQGRLLGALNLANREISRHPPQLLDLVKMVHPVNAYLAS